jgi:hypothetical protein
VTDEKASATFHAKKNPKGPQNSSKRPLFDILYGRLKRPLQPKFHCHYGQSAPAYMPSMRKKMIIIIIIYFIRHDTGRQFLFFKIRLDPWGINKISIGAISIGEISSNFFIFLKSNFGYQDGLVSH